MQNLMFSPQLKNDSDDAVAATLARISRWLLIGVLGLSPILFVPVSFAPFGYSKVLFILGGLAAALIFYSLAALRNGRVSFRLSLGLVAFWGVAIMALVAAILSGDLSDSLIGESFSIHSVSFVALLALIASTVSILSDRKSTILQFYTLLTSCGIIIGLYQLAKLIFGAQFLSFGIFTDVTASPIGSWNDLALFFGLVLLLAMVTIEQIPLTKWGRVLFATLSIIALLILMVVNFFAIWIVLGLASLVVLMYALTKNRFVTAPVGQDTTTSYNTIASIILSVVVFIVSVGFVVGGPAASQTVANLTGVSYVEVRPSMSATADIARGVYSENLFTGIGPNKFADAWRLYKNPAINNTVFWNTQFAAGVGYIPTFAVTMGVFGALAWLIFLVILVYSGVRFLFLSAAADRLWQFVGASSFVAALYLWGMSLLYVPGPVLLCMAAAFTGLLFTAYANVSGAKQLQISLAQNRQVGFLMVAATMVVIVGAVATLFFVGRHYSSLYVFNKTVASLQSGVEVEIIEQQIANAYTLSPNDRFAREIAGIQLSKMNSLLAITEPTDLQRQQLEGVIETGLNAARLAIASDATEPANWMMFGNILSLLVAAGNQAAYERAVEAFTEAETFDPTNPQIKLLQAQLESRVGNLDRAKELALAAAALKPNYSDALLFLTQVDIARGDVAGAIAAAEASIAIEPQNPARYYQLGVLLASQQENTRAIVVLQEAVRLDPQYANARYFLALALDEAGRPTDAIRELEIVRDLNPDNAGVANLIKQLEANGTLRNNTVPEQVVESEVTASSEGEVTTTADPNSPLLSPVNTVPAEPPTTPETTTDEITTPE